MGITDERERASYVLRLYISGSSPESARAIRTVRKLCDEKLAGQVELRVVDVLLQPELAEDAELVALPTLILESPPPRRCFVGRMIRGDRIAAALALRSSTVEEEAQ